MRRSLEAAHRNSQERVPHDEPITPDPIMATARPREATSSSTSSDLNHDSYFPPWDEYWTKRVPSPPNELHPLLPTPVSPALPLPELSLDDDDSQSSGASHALPTCSCPAKDTCVVESLALLLGSAALLTATAEYLAGDHELSNWTVGQSARPPLTPIAPVEIARFEPTLKKLLLPLVSGNEIDVAEVLLEHWKGALGRFADRDLCGRLRRCLDSMGIDLVDTFAPLQNDMHLLLALIGFDDPGFQSRIENIPVSKCSAKVKLMIEANSQLVMFSVKDILMTAEELQRELQAKVEELACKVAMHEIGVALEASRG